MRLTTLCGADTFEVVDGRKRRLLEAGLDAYRAKRFKEAQALWGQAAAIHDPPEPQPQPAELAPVVREVTRAPNFVGKAQFEDLLRQKRYEEALAVLYRMRRVAPENASVSRGITLLKDTLFEQYLEQLGTLDGVPTLEMDLSAVSGDEAHVARLVDGIATLADVFAASKLGRAETAKVLVELLERGQLALHTSGIRSSPTTIQFVLPAAAPVGSVADVVSAPAADEEDALFQSATDAYLERRYAEALALFRRGAARSPGDKRVAHNVALLEQLLREQG